MRRIEHLPEAVRSSVRSGIILHDLTRVVEELIFNSLDAGATKVYVAVGVGTCFVKLVDNGYGVDRDGLVLLGERYATSRHGNFHALESRGNFGFHGEALSSIADVSLLEIITKAHGMPHGYRKVMKGCKCLHLGINDENREVGTTVIVRDLFYNQPVRRKRMQSSPKKVLHSLKKCVLRIALVHSTVSFRVADIESEVDLLSTGSSPSPLQLLANNFGVEANKKNLHEVEVNGSELKLSGYISGPHGIFSMKALQYIYINSRFVCKGPIHKLMNQLAIGYVDERKCGDEPQHENKSRLQICPTFILDLSCPKSCYDLTFEPTKNLVEFKDWGSILHFIQKAVTRIWTERISNVDLLPHGEVTKKRRRTQQSLDPLVFPPLDKLKKMKEWDNLRSLDPFKTDALINHDTSNLTRSGFSEQFYPDEDNIWKKDSCFADISCLKTGPSLEPIWQEEPFMAGERIYGHFQRSSQFGSVTRRNMPRHHLPFSTGDVLFESERNDDLDQIFREDLLMEDKTKKDWLFSKCTTTLRDIEKRLSPESEHFDEEDIEKPSPKYIRTLNSESEWTPPALSTLIDTTFEDVFGKDVNFTDIQSNHVYSVGPSAQDELFFDDKFNDSFWTENNSNKGSFFSTCSKLVLDSFPENSDPFYLPVSVQFKKNKDKRIRASKRARRFSAPPFYKHRKKISVLGSSLTEMVTGKTPSPATNIDSPLRELIKLKHEPMRNRQTLNSGGSFLSTPTYVENSFYSVKKLEFPNIEITKSQNILGLTQDSNWKWRNNRAENECTEVQDAILSIGSGILNLSHDLLVPNCISKSNLEEARVLPQVDKKYIPVVAGRTLAIIDQHAADERIRLEELRNKVLSGETRQSTYLEAEQELVVPEIGYQLLQNYSKEIEKWGWICRIDGEGSSSFSKNLNALSRHQTTAKLVGVPCILGVNLSDVDLLEFLQQLADTDGSSTLPPSVHRVLNNKACRGAIMFGDTLLPSECSLIIDELARTSLCFQCAHGRPTTVPLVDLAMLHKQIDSDTRESWHGLQRHEVSLARALHRSNCGVD